MRLWTQNLVKKYKQRTVVNHVSVEVNQGQIVGLLGPNGAGQGAGAAFRKRYPIVRETAFNRCVFRFSRRFDYVSEHSR